MTPQITDADRMKEIADRLDRMKNLGRTRDTLAPSERKEINAQIDKLADEIRILESALTLPLTERVRDKGTK
jgi:hypothetical protein